MQYLHFGLFRKYACGVQAFFIQRSYPKCNTCILGHFENMHLDLSIFIRRSYPKCNTCILGHTTNQATILTTYLTNLATLLITYPTNLTIGFRVETHKLIDKFFINV
jgi:hypothetical protein